MKRLLFWLNGRPRAWDDLEALQNQIATLEGQHHGNGPYIVKGCAVTANGNNVNITPGLVFIDGKIMHFTGANNVPLPVNIIAAAPVESDSRNDSNGVPKNAMIEYRATWEPAGAVDQGGGGINN